MTPQQQILELQDQMGTLSRRLNDLEGAYYKNNFTSSQNFNKDVTFNTRLRVPLYTSAPSVAEVGDLISISGTLFICTSVSPVTFTVVGTQT